MRSPIINFVHDALQRGISREDIIQALKKGGWTAKEITSALDGFVESRLPVPVPRKQVSSSPREAFLFLMLYASLYTAAFALGAVMFDLITLLLPLPGEAVFHVIPSLRNGIAATIVAFPLFLFMCRVMGKERAQNPGQRISPVRRWLTYLTLFVASIAIISDLIVLIVSFLAGDITSRFGLKVLTVGVLAGAAFIYYLRDLRRDEVALSSEFQLSSGARLGFAVMLLAVLTVLGLGIWYAGSPAKARMLSQDEQRVRDLIQISIRVKRHYRNTGSLPETLTACDGNPATFIGQKVDRVTGNPYVYRPKDETHFELGATFLLPAGLDAGKGAGGYARTEDAEFWDHPAGAVLFVVAAPEHASPPPVIH